MTIREALESDAVAIRRPGWDAGARIVLPPREANGLRGPWCTLMDLELALKMLLCDADDGADDWEPYAEASP